MFVYDVGGYASEKSKDSKKNENRDKFNLFSYIISFIISNNMNQVIKCIRDILICILIVELIILLK